MSKSFLFKRGKYYHLQFFDSTEQRIKRISTKKEKKTDAIKFLMEFEKKRKNMPQVRHILLSTFSNEMCPNNS